MAKDTVQIQIAKKDDFRPSDILKDTVREFDSTQNVETMVEQELAEFIGEYPTFFARTMYNCPDSTGSSRWSDTRTFGLKIDTNVIVGFTHVTTGHDPDRAFRPIDRDGKIVPIPNVKENFIYKMIREVTDSHGNVFIEIPKVFVRCLPNGIPGTDTANHPTWIVSPFKYNNEYLLHPAFTRGVTEYSRVRIGKYLNKEVGEEIKSIPDGSILKGKTEKQVTDIITKTNENYRVMDIWDVGLLRILSIIFTFNGNTVKKWKDLGIDTTDNTMIKLVDIFGPNCRSMIGGTSYGVTNEMYFVNPITKARSSAYTHPRSNDQIWENIETGNISYPSGSVSAMMLMLPKTTKDGLTSLYSYNGIRGNGQGMVSFGYPFSKQYTYQVNEGYWYDTYDSMKYYDKYGPSRCQYNYAKEERIPVYFSNVYGSGPSCPYFRSKNDPFPPSSVDWCSKSVSGSHAECRTAVGCVYVHSYRLRTVFNQCRVSNRTCSQSGCPQYYQYNHRREWADRWVTKTGVISVIPSIFTTVGGETELPTIGSRLAYSTNE